jgi:hypothetical protein
MRRTAHLLFAAAIVMGGTSLATAQTAPHDGTPDSTLSYGPKPQRAAPAARTANPAQQPVGGGAYYEHDGTPDKTLSHGPRPQR